MEEKQSNISADLPIKWTGLEHDHKPKSADWFWFVASGALILIIISILMKNFLLGIVAMVGAFSIAVLGAQKPKKLDFAIEKRGIKIGSELYPYREIESFWVNYDPPHKKELVIESKKKIIKHIKIPLSDVDPNLIRSYLKKILKEEEYEETFTDIITEKLGF